MKIGNSNTKINRFSKKFLVFTLLTLTFFIGLSQFNYQPVKAHNPVAYPKELFSLWNDTAPVIDGAVDFTPYDKSGEWSSAAIYNMYDGFEAPDGKLLLQNDDDNLYIGLVIPSFTIEIPTPIWGAIVYLDLGQDGIFNGNDYLLTYAYNNTVESVAFFGYSTTLQDWYLIDGPGLPGATLPGTGMVGNTYFGKSNFDNTTAHRQYEFKLPYPSELGNDEIIGIGFLATDNYVADTRGVSWPFVGIKPGLIKHNPAYWGDLHLGKDIGIVDYVIEDNFQIRQAYVGQNNGSFITTGDIDGDGDLEIIASSNRSIATEPSLMTIFDYDETSGEIVTMWESWTSTYSSLIFKAEGLKCFDFDEDGSDEIYAVSSESSYILRLFGWNDISGDFDEGEYIYENYGDNLMGYLDIGDARNLMDGSNQIVFGDDVGWIGILDYDDKKDEFVILGYLTPYQIGGNDPYKIHDIEIADMDQDLWQETLFFSQITADDTLSTTRLQILEVDDSSYYDNPTNSTVYSQEDDLPFESHVNTEDSFGHTILVEDVDNDGVSEIILVGKDYLKIFGQYMFNDSSIPLVINLTDGTSPNMGGGAAVFDIDDDSDNELIVGHSNGTVFIYEITDSDPDPDYEVLSSNLEWKGDLGTSPGKRNSIIGYDIDEDGFTEAIITDNFGQIIVLGKGTVPELTITSPSPGYVSNQPTVLVTWETSNDTLPMYYYNISVGGSLVGRAGGGQTGFVVPLNPGVNIIGVSGADITGKIILEFIIVEYIAGAPEVTIYDPENYYMTTNNHVGVNYSATDPQGNPIEYTIYVNGSAQYTGTDTYKVVTLHVGGTSYDGVYNITVVAEDTINHDIGRATVFVILDQTIPHVMITSPHDGEAVSASQITLNWDAYDDTTGIDYFEVWLDTDSLGTTSLHSMVIDLPFNKEYIIHVDAYDIVGNFNQSVISVIRDSIDPTITVTEPTLPTSSEGWYMTENNLLFVDWLGSDNSGGSGIDYFVVTINGGIYGSYDEFTFNDTVDLGTEGLKEVAVHIYDLAGNSDFDYFEIALDTSNPFVNITSPDNGYTTSSDTVNIFWDSADSGTGVKEHIIYVDGSPYATITDISVHSYEVPVTFNDTTVITVRAIDHLDKYTDDTVDIIHDPESPTFNINSPLELYSYTNSPLVNLTWLIKKITVDEFHVFVDGFFYGFYGNETSSIIIDLEFLGPIAEGTYPTFNITILVWEGFAFTYNDHCFITVDMTPPTVSILDPLHDDIIVEEDMLVKWSAFDVGSSISGYDIWLNGDHVGDWDSATTEQLIDVTGYSDGEHNITVMAYDYAGNNSTYIITVQIYPIAPEFVTDLPLNVITNNGDFQFNLSITNPRLGVEEIEVVADSEEVIFSIDYNGSTMIDPFWLAIDVLEIDFVSSSAHNLTITVYDSYGRASSLVIDVILDHIDPTIFGFIILDEGVLASSNEVTVYEGTGTNDHNITITARDTNGIASIQLNILGTGVDVWLPMNLDTTQSVGDLYVYNITMNLDSYTEGDYTLRFVVNDMAGNEIIDTFGMSIILYTQPTSGPTGGPLDMQTIIIIASSGGGLILIILLSVIISAATKKKRMNRNWEKDLEAVAYVTKTGLTLAYVPYARDLFEDEQLFGGALTGIVSILGEITGETDVEMKVNVIEFGDKQLVVCPGFFGNAILLVNDVKPIMKDLVVRFTVDFELTYKHNLTQDLIDLNEFSAVPLMVEGIFGVRTAFL